MFSNQFSMELRVLPQEAVKDALLCLGGTMGPN